MYLPSFPTRRSSDLERDNPAPGQTGTKLPPPACRSVVLAIQPLSFYSSSGGPAASPLCLAEVLQLEGSSNRIAPVTCRFTSGTVHCCPGILAPEWMGTLRDRCCHPPPTGLVFRSLARLSGVIAWSASQASHMRSEEHTSEL